MIKRFVEWLTIDEPCGIARVAVVGMAAWALMWILIGVWCGFQSTCFGPQPVDPQEWEKHD